MEKEKTELLLSAANGLSDTSEEIRYLAVKDLSRANSLGAVPLLMQVVSDPSYRVREEALHAICSFPPDTIFPRLESFLRNDADANLRNAAMEAFPRYGERSVPYLSRLLKDYDEEIRIFSAVMLGEVSEKSSVEAIIEALSDPEENVRHAAAETLGKIGDARAVEPLIECLKGDFWLQYPAVTALGQIGDPKAIAPLVSLLGNDMLQEAVIDALGKIGDLSVVPILAEILTQNDPSIRNVTISAMVCIQSRIEDHIVPDGMCLPSIKKSLEEGKLVEHLLSSLKSDEQEIRKNSVIAIGWMKEKRAVKDLIALLTDYDLEEYVIGSLVAIGKDALPELVAALKNPDPRVRGPIIRCIGWIDDEGGIRACLSYLEDEDEEVRLQAITAMAGAVESESVENALLELLCHPDRETRNTVVEILAKSDSPALKHKLISKINAQDKYSRLAAIQLLGKIKAHEAVEPLKKLLKETNDEIRAEVYKSLTAIGPDKIPYEIIASGLVDESPTVRKASVDSLSEIKGGKVERHLIDLLNDPDPEVRIASLDSLGKIGGPSCVENLIGAFSKGDKRFKTSLIKVLGDIGAKSASPFLANTLKDADPDIKRYALESLGKIGSPKSVSDIIVALDDAEWSVRSAAIEALEMIGDHRCSPYLLEKLTDTEDIVKKRAVKALAALGASETVNSILPLIHNENLQLEIIDAIESLGIPDFDFFYSFLMRSNTRLKCLLVDLLGRLKDSKAFDFLEKILGDEFFTVRCRAAKALGEMGDKRALQPLLKSQKTDPCEEVKREATLALKKLDARK